MEKFGYKEMQTELRRLNGEIGKIAKANADRHREERKRGYVMHTPKEVMKRIRQKNEQIIQEQSGPVLTKKLTPPRNTGNK